MLIRQVNKHYITSDLRMSDLSYICKNWKSNHECEFKCSFLALFWMECPDHSKIIWNHHVLDILAQQRMFCFLNPVTAQQLVLERPSRGCVRISGSR